MAERYGVKMKKPGEVTLESEYEKIKKVRTARYTSHERAQFSIERNGMNVCPTECMSPPPSK
jgi:hypothetical protein